MLAWRTCVIHVSVYNNIFLIQEISGPKVAGFYDKRSGISESSSIFCQEAIYH